MASAQNKASEYTMDSTNEAGATDQTATMIRLSRRSPVRAMPSLVSPHAAARPAAMVTAKPAGPGPIPGGEPVGERVAGRGAGGVDGAAPLAALGRLQVQRPGDLDDLAVHGNDPGGRGDLGGGQGEQLALPQPCVGRGAGHQLTQVPAPPGGQGPAEPGHIMIGGI